MNKKTILVAGGAGFIGSHLCQKLINEKNKIICVDNLITGKLKNIEYLMKNNDFKFINSDINEKIIINEKIDEIYNLACIASPPKYQEHSIFTLKTNFCGTLNLLELAKKYNSKILLTSTSEIYGEPQISPQNEEYRGNVNTVGIRSCYDEGKRVAETLMFEYNNKYKIDIKIARIFNTYGSGMDINDGRVVTNFIKQMLNNENITVYGDGKQTRSFCYIDDTVNGLIKLMNSNYNKPINIGNPNEITIINLIEILLKKIDTKSKIIYLNLPKDDPTNRKPDIKLANLILKWFPKVNIYDGLDKTIDYYKKNINQ